jgi:pimeloyl-ACP methyl ester carboxylesterase
VNSILSKDGTTIAFDRAGAGSPVILVNGALGDRAGTGPLARLLDSYFTVYTYDRRGRGDSADTPPYALEREVEDLEAILAETGGSAYVYGTSSGGNLALEAAARGAAITKLALWEPNFLVDDTRPPLPKDYVEHLDQLVASGRRGDAVEYFMTAAAGVPAQFVTPMRGMPMWPEMEALAHTLAYDGRVVGNNMSGSEVSRARWASVTIPTVVIDGGQTPGLAQGADAIAAALPDARRRTLTGQTHDVAADAIAPALREFFTG